ncbi:hypothetical protein H1Q63_19965 [Desmonostoc muscorum CCALA 125]|nr:hypothetical protein [Desmonostoc muscorum CCALA 125]
MKSISGVADCGMKNNFVRFQNPCRDVAMQRLHLIQQRPISISVENSNARRDR